MLYTTKKFLSNQNYIEKYFDFAQQILGSLNGGIRESLNDDILSNVPLDKRTSSFYLTLSSSEKEEYMSYHFKRAKISGLRFRFYIGDKLTREELVLLISRSRSLEEFLELIKGLNPSIEEFIKISKLENKHVHKGLELYPFTRSNEFDWAKVAMRYSYDGHDTAIVNSFIKDKKLFQSLLQDFRVNLEKYLSHINSKSFYEYALYFHNKFYNENYELYGSPYSKRLLPGEILFFISSLDLDELKAISQREFLRAILKESGTEISKIDFLMLLSYYLKKNNLPFEYVDGLLYGFKYKEGWDTERIYNDSGNLVSQYSHLLDSYDFNFIFKGVGINFYLLMRYDIDLDFLLSSISKFNREGIIYRNGFVGVVNLLNITSNPYNILLDELRNKLYLFLPYLIVDFHHIQLKMSYGNVFTPLFYSNVEDKVNNLLNLLQSDNNFYDSLNRKRALKMLKYPMGFLTKDGDYLDLFYGDDLNLRENREKALFEKSLESIKTDEDLYRFCISNVKFDNLKINSGEEHKCDICGVAHIKKSNFALCIGSLLNYEEFEVAFSLLDDWDGSASELVKVARAI